MSESSFVDEGKRIIAVAEERNIILRLIGAVAFHLHCPKYNYFHQSFGRKFTDIDYVSYKKFSGKIRHLFKDIGYEEDQNINTLFGFQRLLFYDYPRNRHSDVFLEKLMFCHDILFSRRLELDSPTAPLAELLLEKMQIVELNEKDVVDTFMLLREHEVGESDEETINSRRIAELCADDWGLWKTVTTNLRKMQSYTSDYRILTPEDAGNISLKIQALLKRVDDQPKSMRWSWRARLGEKKKWYRSVEEIAKYSA